MSAAADYNTDDEFQKMVMRWQTAGHTYIPERSTFRHRDFKKDLPPDTVIKRDGVPFITNHGKTLTFGDVLPERADLCIDADGNVLPQHMFAQRYEEILKWVALVEGSDPKSEYVPHVERYISQVPDTFSESPGMVEIGFDARKPAEEVRTHVYDSNKDEMIEIVKQQGETMETTLQAVKVLLEREPAKRGPGRPPKHAD